MPAPHCTRWSLNAILLYIAIYIFCLALASWAHESNLKARSLFQSRDKCPLTCKCTNGRQNFTEWTVKCEKRKYWNTIPPLPRNTSYFSMINSNMPVLFNGAFSKVSGKTLRILILIRNSISSIEAEAFKNLNQLKELILSENKLTTLYNGTFLNIPNLTTLAMEMNRFQTMPVNNICLLKNLRILKMKGNNIESAKFDECFTQMKDLNSVDISNNPITEIKPVDFYGLRNSHISQLFLTQLGLTTLSKDHFQYVPHLRVLSLQKNKFISLKADVFQDEWGLTSLILGRNQLKNIPGYALSKMPYLQTLNLEQNNITNCTFSEEFQNMTNLRTIDLGKNAMGSLTKTSFTNFYNSTRLTELILSFCKLQVIEADTFLPLRSLKRLRLDNNPLNARMLEQAFYGLRFAYNLSQLYLESTNLAALNNETFQYLVNTSLVRIEAKGSALQVLKMDTFKYLSKLSYLSLTGKGIKEIQANVFQSVNNLEWLDLSKNSLLTVPDATTVNLQYVKVLLLGRNSLKGTVNRYLFRDYTNVEKLNLYGNAIRVIGPYAFCNMSHLKRLDLMDNEIYTLRNNAFAGLDKLEVLILSNNNIDQFDLHIFTQTPSLQSLDLHRNYYFTSLIGNNMVHVFQPLRNLTTLNLVSTGLHDLPNSIFHNLTELKTVKLSTNQLSKWDPGLFRDQKKLKFLSLTKNKITTIYKSSLEHLTALQELDVANNMFACDCNLLWFANWIKTRSFIYFDNLDSVICKSPAKKHGIKLIYLHMESECMSLTFYYVYWSMLLCYTFIVTLVTVLYRLRWYIK